MHRLLGLQEFTYACLTVRKYGSRCVDGEIFREQVERRTTRMLRTVRCTVA
ncbi:hypothetical protein BURMUCF1_A1956 [Burkholderia multivorans ATCC BAA-247]|uniref:Uncharacterized protein n=1 Tax=Burkholderia multivorans CGD2 TaxID=513052 RepID=B9BLQ0_9BURK|nr:hypothetical protein BURMUCGD2_6008 [Burkholderia multivorans CGD2]EEE16552.1 hypothetical protein BURMUCGD2M_5997 [Burkholderia multivorans CGD2M]EJO52099.1 hypothetical protein BURMUCF1_A1956 [Burkholderia multivorans ATCC BAA-247]